LLFGVLVAGPAFADAPMARLKYVVPKAELAEGSQATVEKDGVKIIVELDPFLEKVHHKVEVAEESSWFIVNDKHTYEIQRIPASIDLAPRELRFKVRVINNLPNVLKMSGTVVSLTANGKQIPVPASAYSELVNGIIRPRQQQEYTLLGPALDIVPDNANISLAFDDVVTAVDGAGNPSKRTSFEWVYTMVKTPQEKELAIEVSRFEGTPHAAQLHVNTLKD